MRTSPSFCIAPFQCESVMEVKVYIDTVFVRLSKETDRQH